MCRPSAMNSFHDEVVFDGSDWGHGFGRVCKFQGCSGVSETEGVPLLIP